MNRLKCVGIAFLAAVAAALPLSQAHADDSYYLEIGGDATKDDAAKNWQALQAKHKALLGKLQYYPKTVLKADAAEATRIQAGPVAEKAHAQRICSRLFAEKTPCFVIEGINGAPPTEVISMNAKTGMHLPWDSAPAAPPPPAAPPQGLPWLSEKPKSAEASPQQAAAPTPPAETPKGNVEVYEAIRVPLSDTLVPADAPVEVRPLPEPKKESSNLIADEGSGWINVSAFPDDEAASAFWEQVRQQAPDKTAGLRVRIMRPLSARGPATTLVVGPFAGRPGAEAFCRDRIDSQQAPVRCRFVAGEPEGASQPFTTQANHSDAYGERRRMVEQGLAAKSVNQYWVQAISAKSEMDALQKWEDIRTNNGDLLAGKRSSVAASGDGSYVVRIGPIGSNDEALTLCNSLKQRKVGCRVILYTSQ